MPWAACKHLPTAHIRGACDRNVINDNEKKKRPRNGALRYSFRAVAFYVISTTVNSSELQMVRNKTAVQSSTRLSRFNEAKFDVVCLCNTVVNAFGKQERAVSVCKRFDKSVRMP